MVWITPYSQDTDFTYPLMLESKIRIFEEQTLGWVLDIADASMNGEPGFNGTLLGGPVLHSGYAVLQIVFVYFELIARMVAGEENADTSEHYFRQGVQSVYPELSGEKRTEEILRILYRSARRGLYDAGRPKGRIVLSGRPKNALTYDRGRRLVLVNPHCLVPDLKEHFRQYVAGLRDPANRELRRNFETMFDLLGASDPLVQDQYYSCFISYCKHDRDFAARLNSDLQAKGVSTWFFDEDARAGRSVWSEIDRGTRVYDKVVVICSEHSLRSAPVLREIERALQREDREGRHVLFPIRLDDYVFDEWEHERKADVVRMVVGDFRGWDSDPAKYGAALEKLLKDLQEA